MAERERASGISAVYARLRDANCSGLRPAGAGSWLHSPAADEAHTLDEACPCLAFSVACGRSHGSALRHSQ